MDSPRSRTLRLTPERSCGVLTARNETYFFVPILLAEACGSARTLTIWRDEAALMGFVFGPVHAAAMTIGPQMGEVFSAFDPDRPRAAALPHINARTDRES